MHNVVDIGAVQA